MFTKSLTNSIQTLFKNVAELMKLQFQLYLLELKRNRKALVILASLCVVAVIMFIGGVLLALGGVASLLTSLGMSMPAALLTTALIAFTTAGMIGFLAMLKIRSRLQRFSAPNREFKLNIDCIRTQFLKSRLPKGSDAAKSFD